MLVAALFVVWVWLSWRGGWFPFNASGVVAPQQTQESILNSLSAPTTPTTNPTSILKQLTPSTSVKSAATTTATLQSLTAP